MRLKPHVSLIIRSGASPIKARQFIWYKDSHMKKLKQPPASVPQQLIVQEPFVRAPKKPKKQKTVAKKKESEEAEFDWVNELEEAHDE
jgi:type IV secretory pathway TraG/TraD family ATPase VirD4